MRPTERRWCATCKLMTLGDCHPPVAASSPPPPPASGPGVLSTLAIPASAVRKKIRPMALLALSCRSVAGGSTVTITSHPFVICRPLRLVVDPLLAPRFDLLGIRIGVMSQNAGEGWISCSCFPPHPEGGDPVDNLAGLPIVMPGQAFAIEVQNKTAFASDFSAYLRVGLVA